MLKIFVNPNDPVFFFTVLLLIIFIFPSLFSRIKLPYIIGLIIAGIIIGPNALGIIEKNSAMQLFSKIGLLYIMFLAGLEIELIQIKRNFNNTLFFGLITFFIPLIIGTIVAYFVLKMNLVPSILLASMFSSHTLITYPIVSKLRILKNKAVTSAIGGTIITDILALFVLALITGTAGEHSGYFFWIKFFIFLILYILAIIFIMPRITRLFFKIHAKTNIQEYLFVLLLVFVCGYLAHFAGLEPIIGAFLAGLILNSYIPKNSILMNRIHFVGEALFIPVFLISVGMLIDFRILLTNKLAWLVSGCMIIVAVLSKLLASVISGFFLKWKKEETGLVFGMSVNQAAATLAAVLVGYDLKIFDEAILTGTIMMISITCFIGPFITEYFGKKVEIKEKKDELEESKNKLRILVPIRNKDNIKHLMDLSFALYKKFSSDTIFPLNIVIDDLNIENKIIESEKLLTHTIFQSEVSNVNIAPVTRVELNIASGILKAIKELRISCVITGWDGNKNIISKIFSHNLDYFIENSNQLLIVNKIIFPFNFFKRILILIPPLFNRQKGYEQMLNLIKIFADHFKTSIVIIAEEDIVNAARDSIINIKNELEINFVRLNSWKNILITLHNEVKNTDIIVLFSIRIGRPAWQPSLNKLPGLLSKTFQKNNIMILFSADEKLNIIDESICNKIDMLYKDNFLYKEDIYFGLEKFALEDAIKNMLLNRFGTDNKDYEYLASLLIKTAHKESLQLLNDVAFIHVHVTQVEDYVFYIGINKNGFKIHGIQENTTILLILLNSSKKPPERHLELLKIIVKTIKTPGFIESLQQANSIDEFEKLMISNCNE